MKVQGNIEKYQELMGCANALESSFARHVETAGKGSCDKHGYGFNLDYRFSSMMVSVSFDSWRGYYGYSGCSTSISAGDGKIFAKAFIRYLNKNKNKILDEVVEIIRNEATEYKSAAKKELAEIQELLKVQEEE